VTAYEPNLLLESERLRRHDAHVSPPKECLEVVFARRASHPFSKEPAREIDGLFAIGRSLTGDCSSHTLGEGCMARECLPTQREGGVRNEDVFKRRHVGEIEEAILPNGCVAQKCVDERNRAVSS
jgi:hypothetical protein